MKHLEIGSANAPSKFTAWMRAAWLVCGLGVMAVLIMYVRSVGRSRGAGAVAASSGAIAVVPNAAESLVDMWIAMRSGRLGGEWYRKALAEVQLDYFVDVAMVAVCEAEGADDAISWVLSAMLSRHIDGDPQVAAGVGEILRAAKMEYPSPSDEVSLRSMVRLGNPVIGVLAANRALKRGSLSLDMSGDVQWLARECADGQVTVSEGGIVTNVVVLIALRRVSVGLLQACGASREEMILMAERAG